MKTFLICALIGGSLLCLYMIIRNELVYRFRIRIADLYHDANMRELRGLFSPRLAPIEQWRAYDLRCNLRRAIYHSVTYEDMMRQWWKPLGRFYTNEDMRLLSGADVEVDTEVWDEVIDI